MTADKPVWTSVAPGALLVQDAKAVVLGCATSLEVSLPTDADSIRRRVLSEVEQLPAHVALETRAMVSLLCDLRGQGWYVRVVEGDLQIAPPERVTASVEERKAQVRAGLLIERDAQLRDPAIRRFVREMERRRLVGGHWHSIYSLMRDGRDLAAKLERYAAIEDLDRRADELSGVVAPYVEMVEADAVCRFTGLRLTDIWRYFRYTWNTVYQSTPGRKMFFLVRDAAAPFHPVMGIGALGSSIVQMGCRDEWIGWHPKNFIRNLKANPSVERARWLHRALQELIGEIYITDFIRQGIFTRRELTTPTPKLVKRLGELAGRERAKHQLYPDRRKHKAGATQTSWAELARTPLFRAKRAQALADLLGARLALQAAGFRRPSRKALTTALENQDAIAGIVAVLRRVKASRVGVNMMDITVCGAVAPYNALLGGKLVGLLAAGPDVVRAYERRYIRAASIIASSLGGKAVIRSPKLVLLGTTSLYDVATSQYNRLSMPAEAAGGAPGERLAFVRLGLTKGYGSFHFSQSTLSAFDQLLARDRRGRQVNSIFGEGVNPKLRKVRGALDQVGMPSDLLLRHGTPRLVFGVPIAKNFRDILLGFASRVQWLVPRTPEVTAAIVAFWRRRWLAARVGQAAVRDAVRQHSLAYPMKHGARVALPPVEGEDGPLFDYAPNVGPIPQSEGGPPAAGNARVNAEA